ncbi:hypothetical protein [Paenibacillus sp. FSL R7-0652]|uniref:hypothetical protein n=1 Tax=Paenibacillus sp. FSL R7-0652 TaxID=2921687 RepID=UPI00315A4E20
MKTIKITVDGKAAGGGGFYFEGDVCSGQAGDKRHIIKCTAVLESLREIATEEQIERYRVFLAGIK